MGRGAPQHALAGGGVVCHGLAGFAHCPNRQRNDALRDLVGRSRLDLFASPSQLGRAVREQQATSASGREPLDGIAEPLVDSRTHSYTTWFMPPVDLAEAGLTEFRGNNFSIGPQMGLEVNGFGRRWFYAFGLVNGNLSVPAGTSPDSSVSFVGMGKGAPGQDFYWQLAYKLGGIPFDRRDEEQPETLTAGAEFWRDDSLTFSLYGYRGTAQIRSVDLEENTWQGSDDFWRLGFGVQKMIRDVSLSFAYLGGKNNNPYGNLTELPVNSRTWHAEALGFVYPWLLPYLRYESLHLDMPSDVLGIATGQDIERLMAGAKFMIRPNVSFTIEGAHYITGAELEEGFDKTLFMLLAV